MDDVTVPLDLRPVAHELGLGRQGLSGQAARVTLLNLGHPLGKFRQADVALLERKYSEVPWRACWGAA
jgi:hypothetical protein